MKAWIWRTSHKMSVGHDQIVAGEKFDVICICYQWLGEKKIHSLDWGLHKQDSTAMLEAFAKVVEQADIVVAHNGDSFDAKQLNTQRLLHNQAPITWPTSEDTLKSFRKHFAFPSFKLDYLAKALTGSGKDQMCFQDWIDIVDGKKREALDKMIAYCKRDVKKLAQVYEMALPHLKPKANRAIILGTGKASCPSCGSNKTRSKGAYYTVTGYRKRRVCLLCAHSYTISKAVAT